MKGIGYYIIFLMIVIIIVPGLIVKSCKPLMPEKVKKEHKIQEKKGDTITLYINNKQETENMDIEEYVKGVVAAEMPASFEIEAIKAQAVAARTYAYKRWKKAGGKGCALHPEADVCDDPAHCQAWITKGEMLKKWGIFAFYHYNSKINQAVKSTAGMILLYDEEPIDPLFFSTSNGKTENSEDVWKKHIPYLRSVVSKGEETSPRFLEIKKIPVEEFVSKLRLKWPDIKIDPKNLEKQWEVVEISEGGRVKKLKIGNKIVAGTEIRALFNLNSTDFKLKQKGNYIQISCTGYGHGVGMSQYGANFMAKNGSTFVDILKHYYSGVEIKKCINR